MIFLTYYAVLIFIVKLCGAEEVVTDAKPFERLPADVIPVNYALTFKPDLNKGTFEGKANITIKFKKNTNIITVNSVGLNISDVQFSCDGEIKNSADIEYNKDDDTVKFVFKDEITEESGVLSMAFVGILRDDMEGFYKIKYKVDEEEKLSAATQFEPTDARKAFPCWDEPALKATFDITLIVPCDRLALSNMPVKQESNKDGLKTVEFQRSPIMSTYLVAMVVGEYDYVETRDSNSVLIRVYTPLGKKEHGKFALEVANKSLPFYTEYFEIPYPLPKLDLIAIPEFASGAMENWGLVTYREMTLLVDPTDSSVRNRERVATVVGHELAHQWFGNLVTMEWWSDLWLNEGFAAWVEYLAVDLCFPEFNIWNSFITSTIHNALDKDALKSSHPIEVEVKNPSEIKEIFDEISYSKGASIIHMLHNYLGNEDFKKGLRLYLKSHQYNNTKTEDLWAALSKVSNESIKDIMSSWTTKMGYPVITVEEVNKDGKISLKVSQERFIADGSPDEDNYKWIVPLVVNTSMGTKKALIRKKNEIVEIKEDNHNYPLRVNEGAVGFYRVQYVGSLLEKLLPKISTFDPIDRLTIQNDLFALSAAGKADPVDILKLAKTYSSEREYAVWDSLDYNLKVLYALYQSTDFIEKYEKFMIDLYTPLFNYVGWDADKEEDPLKTLLRNIAIITMGKCNNQEVVEEAKKRFENQDKSPLPSDLKVVVYSTVVKNGGEEKLNKLMQMYRNASTEENKLRALISLGATPTKELKQKVLNFSLGPEVKDQDRIYGIYGVVGTPEGRQLAWEFIKKNWANLKEKYDGFLLTALIKLPTVGLSTQADYDDVKKFFEDNPCPEADNTIKQSLEKISFNIKRLKREADKVRAYLNENPE